MTRSPNRSVINRSDSTAIYVLDKEITSNQVRLLVFPSPELIHITSILRLLNTNVDGKRKIMFALTEIKGVGPDLYLEPPLQHPPTSRLAIPGSGTSKKRL